MFFQRMLTDIFTIDQQSSADRIVETQEKIDDRALAGTGSTHDGEGLSPFDREGNILQHRGFTVVRE